MKFVDRLLAKAAALHAKRTQTVLPPAPPRMVFTAPSRDYTDNQACVTCAIVWDNLDVLGASMPADTEMQHFLQSVGAWWVATTLAGDRNRLPLVAHLFQRALEQHGVPAFITAASSGGNGKAH